MATPSPTTGNYYLHIDYTATELPTNTLNKRGRCPRQPHLPIASTETHPGSIMTDQQKRKTHQLRPLSRSRTQPILPIRKLLSAPWFSCDICHSVQTCTAARPVCTPSNAGYRKSLQTTNSSHQRHYRNTVSAKTHSREWMIFAWWQRKHRIVLRVR